MSTTARYACAIFLSALLLFQIQPVIAKYILPWFGGTPAVWTTCMVFFQVTLLIGYAYAHLSIRLLSPRRQAVLHGVLLLGCLALLPVIPSETWKPVAGSSENWGILGLLAVTIGGPYWVLSANAPLLQAWFSREKPGTSPYRLYALSNAGSLLALVSYPFLVEPGLSLRTQVYTWSATFVVFAAFCGWCVWHVFRSNGTADGMPASPDSPAPQDAPDPPRPGWFDRVLVLLLPACACVLLLATTNQMSQDLPVVPFLWVLPLALYLLSFIICFDRERWYWRPLWIVLLAASLGGVYYALEVGVDLSSFAQVGIYSGALFVCCMICHGELARLKPHPRFLTGYYLRIALGGAIGGVFVTLVAPRLFRGFWEFQGGLVACGLLLVIVMLRGRPDRPKRLWRLGLRLAGCTTGLGLLTVLSVAFVRQIRTDLEGVLVLSRNFYGVLRVDVVYEPDEGLELVQLTHGRIYHGTQFLDDDYRYYPTSYYGPGSGIEAADNALRSRARNDVHPTELRMAVVGLGAGVVAAYGQAGDYVRFYEINPDVVRLSDEYFSYRDDSAAVTEVVLGDARLSMEREIDRGEPGRFDVIVLDAFSGDAIPLHLVTREAMAIYLHHLKPDGVLAFHVSNRHVELEGLIRGLAAEAGKQDVLIETDDDSFGHDSSTWVLVTACPKLMGLLEQQPCFLPWPDDWPTPVVFTDDYSNVFQLLRTDFED